MCLTRAFCVAVGRPEERNTLPVEAGDVDGAPTGLGETAGVVN